jgi:KaiC/GvpD/RAD55 family RecA-like ATPase
MKNFFEVSPLKLLERSSHKGLGKGNLGVLMAGPGLGKTSCLIHIAFHKLFRQEKLVHISLKDSPEKVTSYYHVIFNGLIDSLDIEKEHEIRDLLDKNRMIFAYLKESFDLARLRRNLYNLIREVEFIPHTLIVDGIDFAETRRDIFKGFKRAAEEFQVEVWFSALSNKDITEVDKRGAPFLWGTLDDLFSLIIQLSSSHAGVFLKLLKDHDREPLPGATVRLDPNTFLAIE